MTYLVAALLVRGVVEGVKKALPSLGESFAKALAVLLSAGVVFAYDVNALRDIGMASRYPFVDQAASVLVLALLSMMGHDLLEFIRKAKDAAGKVKP